MLSSIQSIRSDHSEERTIFCVLIPFECPRFSPIRGPRGKRLLHGSIAFKGAIGYPMNNNPKDKTHPDNWVLSKPILGAFVSLISFVIEVSRWFSRLTRLYHRDNANLLETQDRLSPNASVFHLSCSILNGI